MRRALIVIVALVAVIAVALFGALTLIPESVYHSEITKAAKNATGRDLTIEGGIGISLFPVLGVKAEGVTLSNAPGFAAPQFARMKELDAGVKLWPLLSGKVEIVRFVLVEPEIALEVDAKGNNNWTFESAEKPTAAAEEKPEAAREGGAELSDLSFGTLGLQNGRVSYANKQSGEKWEASDINLSVALPNLDEPLKVDGDARWKGERVNLALNAEKPRALLDGAASPVSLNVKADLLKLSFDGEATNGEALALSGPIDLSTPSLRKLLSWLSEPMGEGKTLGAFALKGDLTHKGDVSRIDNAALSLDGMKGNGKLSVNTAPARPFIDATLALDRLDLDPYLGGASTASTKKSGSAGGGGGGAGGASGTTAGGWSSERMDFSGLKSADANLALTAAKVLFGGMTLTDSTLDIRLRNGVLTADLSKIKLYGGSGTAKVVLNASGGTPSLQSNLSLNTIDIEPLLHDAADFDKLLGTGVLTLSVTSRGTSERALMQNLNGTGSLKLLDGAIRGVNLAAMARNLASAFSGGATGSAQKTDFAELGGSFAIQNGVLANNDLLMVNPYLRLAGSGTANIVNQTVNYRFVPKLVKSSEGQGGALDLTGVSVPVRVTGSWDNLKFAPDAQGMVEGALKGVGEAMGAGQDPLKGAIQGIFGRPGAKPTQEEGGAADTSGATESSGGTQDTTGDQGTWVSGGSKTDETGGTETAPAQESATTEEKEPPPPEEQMLDIFQDILKPKPQE